MNIILPHSGYKRLIVYQKSELIYQGTVLFSRRFLPRHVDRTVDQMTQAARSCKQNIAEGSAAAGTSLETQIKLTNVARASLDELLEDYLDYMKAHSLTEWPMGSPQKEEARNFSLSHETWEERRPRFDTAAAEDFCNQMIVLIQQARYLLNRMISWQENDFKQHGGVRERMHAARTEKRAEGWETAIYSMLDLAESATDLQRRFSALAYSARRMAEGIMRKKGWKG